MGSHSWSAAKATMAQYFRDGKMSVLVQWGPAKDPEISDHAKRDVPLILDYARNDMDREVLTLFNSSNHRQAFACAAGRSRKKKRASAGQMIMVAAQALRPGL